MRTLISETELRRHRALYFAVLGAVTIAFTLAFLFPVYWMVTGALKSPAELVQPTPTLVPESFRPGSYADAWNRMDIARYFFNTVFYAVGGWLFILVLDVAVAYALSKLRPILGG